MNLETIGRRRRRLDLNLHHPYDPKESCVQPWKIGLDLTGVPGPLKRSLALAARLGAEGVSLEARGEIDPRELTATGRRQLRKLLDDLRLRISAIDFLTRGALGDPYQIERRIAGAKAALELAFDLRCPVVVHRTGVVGPDPASSDWPLFVEVLGEVVRHGHRVGASWCIETGWEGPAAIRAIEQAIDGGGLGVDLNPGQSLLAGHWPQELVETLGRSLLHVHLSDAVRDDSGSSALVAPGQGQVNIAALVESLVKADYRGYFSVERWAMGDPVPQWAACMRYLRDLRC